MGQSRGNTHPSSKASRARRLLGWRGITTVSVVMLLLAAVVPITVSDNTEGSARSMNTNVWLVLTLALLLTILFYVLLSLGLQFAGVDGDAPTIAQHLAAEPDQQRLLQRWLERARWARFVGGFAGVIAWLLGTQTDGDLLVLGTGGIAIGAVLAEMHHIRPGTGPRTARIEVRNVGDYLLRRDALRMAIVAVASAVVAIVGVWSDSTRTATWWALGALAALGIARVAQQRVATRARPAVSDSLTRADDLVRELAIGRGLGRPFTFFALALVARACFGLEATVGDAAQALGVIAWIVAFVLWWQNRRLGLDFLMSGTRDPVIA